MLGIRPRPAEAKDMLEDHPNAVLARSLWTAVAQGDAVVLRALLADNVVWRIAGRHQRVGPHRGPDAVIDYFAGVGEIADEVAIDLEAIYPNDEGVVIVYRTRAKRGTRVLDMIVLLRLEVRDSVIVRAHAVPVDQPTNDEFWS